MSLNNTKSVNKQHNFPNRSTYCISIKITDQGCILNETRKSSSPDLNIKGYSIRDWTLENTRESPDEMVLCCSYNKVGKSLRHIITFNENKIVSAKTIAPEPEGKGGTEGKCTIKEELLIEIMESLKVELPKWDHPTVQLLRKECSNECLDAFPPSGNFDDFFVLLGKLGIDTEKDY